MNAYDILYGLEYIDKDLTEKAVNYKRNSLIYLRAVAAACLILVFGVSAVLSGIAIRNSVSIRESDISKRFGVCSADNQADAIKKVVASEGYQPPVWNFIDRYLNGEYFSLIYGKAKNIETYKTETPHFTWYITIFDIEIIRAISNAPESGTVKVCAVTFSSDIRSSYYKASEDFDILNDPEAFFILNNADTPKNTFWNEADVRTIGETDIYTFDYADYYLTKQCEMIEDIVRLYDAELTLDELEEFKANGIPDEKRFYDISKKNSDRIREIKRANTKYQPSYGPDDHVMKEFENGDFSIKVILQGADEDFDYSKIMVRVYDAKESFRDSGGGVGYDSTYRFSVALDKDGTAVFDRPTDHFSIIIDEYTLPENAKQIGGSFFYGPDERSDTIILKD